MPNIEGLVRSADAFCRDRFDIRSDPRSMAEFAATVAEPLAAENERLRAALEMIRDIDPSSALVEAQIISHDALRLNQQTLDNQG